MPMTVTGHATGDGAYAAAITVLTQGAPEQAAVLFRLVLAEQPAHAGALYLLGRVLRDGGDAAGGVARRWAFLADSAALPLANLDLGRAFADAGAVGVALECLFQAYAQWPDDPAGVVTQAIQTLASAHQAVEDPDLKRRMARFLFEQAHPQAAAWLTGLPWEPQLCLDLGHIFFDSGRFPGAAAAFAAAAAAGPDLALAWECLGHAAFRQGHRDLALIGFRRSAHLTPGDAGRWRYIAVTLFTLERYAESLSMAVRAVNLEPAMAEGWAGVGHAAFHRRDHAAAETAFRRARAIAPEDDGIPFLIALSAARRLSRLAVWDVGDRECRALL